MDYEKKYKETLERAKEIIECSKTDTKEVRMILSFFPELKESEDEKIRKELIKGIGRCSEENILFNKEVSKSKVLAWLEEQGKQKHQYISRPKYIGEDYEFVEQKPAEWSITDEDMFTTTVWHIKNSISNGKPDTITDSDVLYWFKSLKDRILSQPKQEWSEEDEEMVQVAINACNSYQDSLVRNDSRFDKAVKAEEWLKSLRSQNRWKPSEEQLYALDYILNYHVFGDTNIREKVQSLYDDLKKL